MRKARLYMDTMVDIQVPNGNGTQEEEIKAAILRAFHAFYLVEQACSRFSPESELSLVYRTVGTPVPVSPLLFEPLKFALTMAEWTGGVFDPTIGGQLEKHGFNTHYLTRQTIEHNLHEPVSYKDILLNERDRTILLRKPMVIDLGAVAKGFAIDLAVNELKPFGDFLINAGGDLYAGGHDENGSPWKIGIQHPWDKEASLYTLELSNEAICTSGSYERPSLKTPGLHHIVHPQTGVSPQQWVSSTVVAPYAMMADAFSTASMLFGPGRGESLVEEAGLKGLWVTVDLQMIKTGEI